MRVFGYSEKGKEGKKEFLKTCKELYKRGYRRNFRMSNLYEPVYSDLFYHYYKVMDEARYIYIKTLVSGINKTLEWKQKK